MRTLASRLRQNAEANWKDDHDYEEEYDGGPAAGISDVDGQSGAGAIPLGYEHVWIPGVIEQIWRLRVPPG
ncbi:hypothetical protein [Arthrobacter sp. 3Tela_A]|uniref:hypothetical protein n=1 Tax=Arthrobacter sp. 3Tela_A TaxID=3093743 RepID=UPI003BB68165